MRTLTLLSALLGSGLLPTGGASAADTPYAQAGTALPAAPSPDDEFGWEMDADGDAMIVTRLDFSHSDGVEHNEIFVMRRDAAGAWQTEAQLQPAIAGAPVDTYWARVAISGDRVLVGLPASDPAASGRAFVFEREASSGQWRQAALLNPEAAAGSGFGGSVDIDRNTLVVGSSTADIDGSGGAAYVYQRGVHGWRLAARLVAPAGGPRTGAFGDAVAIDSSRIVVGAPYSDATNGRDSAGAVHVYARNEGGSGAWGWIDRFESPLADEADACGSAVAVNGQLVAVACASDLWVYHARSTTAPAHLVDPDGPRVRNFGMRVAFMADGETLVAGAPASAVDVADAVFVYRCPDVKPIACTREAQLMSPSGSNGAFGWDVAIDAAGGIAIAAPRDDTLVRHGGAVYTFAPQP